MILISKSNLLRRKKKALRRNIKLVKHCSRNVNNYFKLRIGNTKVELGNPVRQSSCYLSLGLNFFLIFVHLIKVFFNQILN